MEKELEKKRNKKMDELKSIFTYKTEEQHKSHFNIIMKEIAEYALFKVNLYVDATCHLYQSQYVLLQCGHPVISLDPAPSTEIPVL